MTLKGEDRDPRYIWMQISRTALEIALEHYYI